MKEPPVRVCCGQRHYGVVCGDGKVMCCLCFQRFTVDQLWTDEGVPTNVCVPCRKREQESGSQTPRAVTLPSTPEGADETTPEEGR